MGQLILNYGAKKIKNLPTDDFHVDLYQTIIDPLTYNIIIAVQREEEKKTGELAADTNK